MSRATRWGFTLIELLVVIAIISLLVSILLPSLQSARELARVALCSSNQRSIAVGIEMYATAQGGVYPQIDKIDRSLEDYDLSRGADGDETTIWTCPTIPDLPYVTDEAPICYTFNKIGMTWVNGPGAATTDTDIVRPATSMNFTDGRLNFSWGAWITIDSTSAVPYDQFNDREWFYANGHGLGDSAYEPAADMDATGGPSGVRYRHRKDTAASAAFFDGHVEVLEIDALTKGMFVTGW